MPESSWAPFDFALSEAWVAAAASGGNLAHKDRNALLKPPASCDIAAVCAPTSGFSSTLIKRAAPKGRLCPASAAATSWPKLPSRPSALATLVSKYVICTLPPPRSRNSPFAPTKPEPAPTAPKRVSTSGARICTGIPGDAARMASSMAAAFWALRIASVANTLTWLGGTP